MEKKTETEISAGGLIVSRYREVWYILLMKDRSGKWTFPKGKIEKGETELQAAKREIAEEVSVSDLTKLALLTPSQYWYFRNGSIRKTVHYFLFQAKKRAIPAVQEEEGISEAKWVKLADAYGMIGYPETNTPLLKEAHGLLVSVL